MTLDTADAVAFDSTVSTMAATMRSLGHLGDLGAEDVAHATATPFDGRKGKGGGVKGGGEAVIVVHVTDRDLLATQGGAGSWPGRGGVARSPGLGPVLMSRLSSWLLTAGTVTIKPVLDVTAMPAVDQHDPPAPMAEAVRGRDETCVYPRCGRRAEVCDLDHIESYVPIEEGGPPGQTRPDNLAPCVAGTTGPRPSVTSPTDASPTGRTSGPCPPAPRSPPTRTPRDQHHHHHHADEPDRPQPDTTR